MIYVELEKRNSKQMGKVLLSGSAIAVILYCMIGIFGYASFPVAPMIDELKSKNILAANYQGNKAMLVANFTLLFSVIAAAPLCVLPCKDTIEELFYKDEGMKMK